MDIEKMTADEVFELLNAPIRHVQKFIGTRAKLRNILNKMEETFIVRKFEMKPTSVPGRFIGFYCLV